MSQWIEKVVIIYLEASSAYKEKDSKVVDIILHCIPSIKKTILQIDPFILCT
mgnify:CR=1 FL=1